ncbi:hypothetical protein KIPB_014183, partial [Kipferlia bialata]
SIEQVRKHREERYGIPCPVDRFSDLIVRHDHASGGRLKSKARRRNKTEYIYLELACDGYPKCTFQGFVRVFNDDPLWAYIGTTQRHRHLGDPNPSRESPFLHITLGRLLQKTRILEPASSLALATEREEGGVYPEGGEGLTGDEIVETTAQTVADELESYLAHSTKDPLAGAERMSLASQ